MGRGGWRCICLIMFFLTLCPGTVQGSMQETKVPAGAPTERNVETGGAQTGQITTGRQEDADAGKAGDGAQTGQITTGRQEDADTGKAGDGAQTGQITTGRQEDADAGQAEAGAVGDADSAQETDGTGDAAKKADVDQLTDELVDELELGEMEDFLREQDMDSDVSFTGLLRGFLSGEEQADFGKIRDWFVSHSFGALQKNKSYLAQMIILLLAFAMLQGISGIFADSFLSDISFLAVYFLFLYNALRIFASMQEIVYDCMSKIADFTLLVQPVFCMAMIFSSGINSASLTYEMTLLVLYLVQNLLQKLLLPLVFLFLITQFANFAWREEHFSSLAKLLESGVGLAQKVLVTFILGMNLIQGMVAPALDQLKKTAAIRTVGLIPGLGGAMNAVSEMLLGTGLLIKNCVGVTVIVLLIVLCARPLLEIGILAFVYRLLAALSEPVTDKRISGVLDALARAGMLYVKLVLTAILMLFLTVAVIDVATSVAR